MFKLDISNEMTYRGFVLFLEREKWQNVSEF